VFGEWILLFFIVLIVHVDAFIFLYKFDQFMEQFELVLLFVDFVVNLFDVFVFEISKFMQFSLIDGEQYFKYLIIFLILVHGVGLHIAVVPDYCCKSILIFVLAVIFQYSFTEVIFNVYGQSYYLLPEKTVKKQCDDYQ